MFLQPKLKVFLGFKNLIEEIMSNIIDMFREDIKSKYQINYSIPSDYDRILVEKTQIPILIYEEAHGAAFIRTIMLHQNNYNQKCPFFKKHLVTSLML